MMTRRTEKRSLSGLPERVFAKSGRYYYVTAQGKARKWHGLSRVSEGLPALYAALSALLKADTSTDSMGALIEGWKRDVMAVRHSAKTQQTDQTRLRVIGEVFRDFRAGQVQAPDCALFLRQFQANPRTHNQYRQMLRELMRYAVELGHRTDNPVQSLRTMREAPRTRYITDSEMRRIKVAGMRGADGKRTRSGPMLAALIDMAYLTGQDIGMLLRLQWEPEADAPALMTPDGIFFRRAKVAGTTGAAVLIEWSPRLVAVVERLKAARAERLLKKRAAQRVECNAIFTNQAGNRLTYQAAADAWDRAVAASGVKAVMFRDLRAKALTDKEKRDGMGAARDMGAHATDSQTADYVRRKSARKTGATK